MLETLDIVRSGVFAFAAASAIVLTLEGWNRVAARRGARPAGRAVFLFEGGELVDASPAGRRLLHGTRRAESDLGRLLSILSRGFGTDLGQRLDALSSAGRLLLVSQVGAGTLEAVVAAGRLRLTLTPAAEGASAVDRLSLEAAEAELALLRGLAESAPQPIWVVDGSGRLSWANASYLALADKVRSPADDPEKAAMVRALWPLIPLFEVPQDLWDGRCRQARMSLAPVSGTEELWYDVTSIRRGEGSLHLASDVGGLVMADSAREHVVQTLSRTFAHLRTGLAIFDRDRRLVLFNPALVELTGLPVGFLSSQPLVQAVLDRLRDARILPEPRDGATWHDAVAAIEDAATEGQLSETWTLPGGQTYRVTGRPHPDDALAFLFEDISDEAGLTRRQRDEIDLGHAVLDAMDEGIAVFAPSGALSWTNAAYDRLWGGAGDAGRDLPGEVGRWERGCRPSAAWAGLRRRERPHGVQDASIVHADGRGLALRIVALPRGGTMARFLRLDTDEPALAGGVGTLVPTATAREAAPIGA